MSQWLYQAALDLDKVLPMNKSTELYLWPFGFLSAFYIFFQKLHMLFLESLRLNQVCPPFLNNEPYLGKPNLTKDIAYLVFFHNVKLFHL